MKLEYSLRFNSLAETQAVVKSLLNEQYIIGFSQEGTQFIIEIYGRKDSPATTETKEDPLEAIKKKINDAISEGNKKPKNPYKPFGVPKNPYEKPYDPFGGPTIFFYGAGESLLDSLKDNLEEE